MLAKLADFVNWLAWLKQHGQPAEHLEIMEAVAITALDSGVARGIRMTNEELLARRNRCYLIRMAGGPARIRCFGDRFVVTLPYDHIIDVATSLPDAVRIAEARMNAKLKPQMTLCT